MNYWIAFKSCYRNQATVYEAHQPDEKLAIKTIHVIERKAVDNAISEVRSWYATDIFPESGESVDAKCAKIARLTCDNILRLINEMNHPEKGPKDETHN